VAIRALERGLCLVETTRYDAKISMLRDTVLE